jgi:hypothetical protein
MSQNDLSIANQGFASFRSDLNSALQALGSTNSGTSAPSTTYANQLFYDTTNNILKIRNEDNDAFISLFTLDQSNDNIESLTINGALTADSLAVDNFTLNGTELDLSSGDLTIDVAGDIKLDADGSEIFFADGGTDFLKIQNDSGTAQIRSLVSDGDISFIGNDGGSNIEVARFDMSEAGRFGIGTSSPDDVLEVKGSTNTTSRQVKIVDSSDATATHIGQFNNISYFTNNAFYNGSAWTRDDGAVGTAFLGLGDGVVQFGADTGATPTERMRISSGRVLIGTTSEYSGTTAELIVNSSMDIGNGSSSDNAVLAFAKSATTGTIGSIQSKISGFSTMPKINLTATNVGGGSQAGDIEFYTTASATQALRMTINSGGHVLVGQNTSNHPGSGDTVTGVALDGGNGLVYGSRSNGASGIFNTNADNEVVRLHRSGNRVGNITVTTSATSYNTSSDYRLKENVVTDWDATTRLKLLKPSRFNFKADKDKTVDGFIAHEVSSIVPEAVSGEKDAVAKQWQ